MDAHSKTAKANQAMCSPIGSEGKNVNGVIHCVWDGESGQPSESGEGYDLGECRAAARCGLVTKDTCLEQLEEKRCNWFPIDSIRGKAGKG